MGRSRANVALNGRQGPLPRLFRLRYNSAFLLKKSLYFALEYMNLLKLFFRSPILIVSGTFQPSWQIPTNTLLRKLGPPTNPQQAVLTAAATARTAQESSGSARMRVSALKTPNND